MVDTLLRQLLLLVQPIGFVWLALWVLAVVLWRKRQRGCALAAVSLALLLTVAGSTDLPGYLLRRLERPWAGFRPAEMPPRDAIVVLGGAGEPSLHEAGEVHLTRAGDRLVMAVELLRLGKAPVLVVGGGAARFGDETKIEADLVREAIVRWRPAGEVVSLGFCENTRDEAMKVAALAKARGWRHIALVTSASHMERALAVFRHAGIDATAAPCNFLTTVSTAPGPIRLQVPSWHGCEKLSIWLHERVGMLIYRQRGWAP